MNNKNWKAEIDKLVNIWLDVLTSISNDAGWEGDSLLARMIEYGGQPPKGSSNDQSNITLMLAMRLLRDPEPDHYRINPIVRTLLKSHPAPIRALLAKHFYPSTIICPRSNKGWTDSERAAQINQKYQEFRYNVDVGYRLVAEKLEVIDEYELFRFPTLKNIDKRRKINTM